MMRRAIAPRLGVALLLAGSGVGAWTIIPAPARAQAQDQAQHQILAPSAHLGVDTTTLLPGRQNYAPYVIPGACLQAALGVRSVLERDVLPDSAPYAAAGDTLPSAVVATARTCGERFTTAGVPITELPNLVELALAAGDEARARVAAERYVTSQRTAAARGWALYAVHGLYMRAHPKRLGAADTVRLQLDSLGAAAAVPRYAAHCDAEAYASRVFDVPRLRREALALITIDRTLSDKDRDDRDGHGGAGNAVFDLLLAELYDAPNGATARTLALLRQARSLSVPQFMGEQDPIGIRQMLRQAESAAPVPPLTAAYWRPSSTQPGQRTWPVAGKVSIYVANGLNDDPARVGLFRRLLAKYGNALNVTFTIKTQGFFRDSPPLTPEQEADRLAQYYHDVLQLPVTLAIDEAQVQVLPDGRRVPGAAPFESSTPYRFGFIMTDRAGKVILMFPGIGSEAQLDAFIAKALER